MITTTRFAPSPTGLLHLGHAHAALFAWRLARAGSGRFLLRFEDIDPGRCRPEYAEAIAEDLAWLGIDWDGDVRVQSANLPDYAAALACLSRRDLVYPCFCTRADIAREAAGSASAPHGPDGAPLYPGTCRRHSAACRAALLATGTPHALRLDMALACAEAGPLSFHERGEGRLHCDPARFGDIILARKDAPASYHLCVTHDDCLQGVNLVTRGVDLKPATDVQRLLQVLLGWPEPEYAHHELVCGPDGRRLARRAPAATLRDLRSRGVSPAEARAMAGFPDGLRTPSSAPRAGR
ncbi:MAG: tRNA glutamyl-Q(34) synthetase GluQRS [Alphaproteobacteria bacterium]|nr:tRNA glutamyl-Q(34) synthetase GluQRS [Alphaproteobacteria bacterium]